jgi:SAM-dependent methyltransferase
MPTDTVTRQDTTSRPGFAFFEGFVVTSVFASLEMAGILERLEEGALSIGSLDAQDKDASALLAAALLYLTRRGLLEREDDAYTLTELGRAVSKDKGYLVWLNGGYAAPLSQLDRFIAGERRYDVDVTRDGRWVADGSALLGREDVVPAALELLEGVEFERVLDLGCGNARFLAKMLEQSGERTGIGVDVSAAACEQARELVHAAGLDGRVEIVQGDAIQLEEVELDRIQLVTVLFMLHEVSSVSRASAVEFLARLSSRLPHGAHILVAEVEPALGSSLSERLFTPEFTLMHAMMRQSLLTEDSWREVFAEGGFDVEQVVRPPMPGSMLIMARRKDR